MKPKLAGHRTNLVQGLIMLNAAGPERNRTFFAKHFSMRYLHLSLIVIFGVTMPATAPFAADRAASDLRDIVTNYSADRGDLLREYDVPDSPVRRGG